MTHARPEMNTTPLIDVLLVLLTLLIITLPLTTHKVALDLPGPGAAAQTHPLIRLEVDFDGALFWNGSPVRDTGQLTQWLRRSAADPLEPILYVQPDRRAPYDQVAQVLAAAQRAHVTRLALAPTR